MGRNTTSKEWESMRYPPLTDDQALVAECNMLTKRVKELELTVENLLMICRRFDKIDDPVSHALRIASKVGITPSILREKELGD